MQTKSQTAFDTLFWTNFLLNQFYKCSEYSRVEHFA